ncbi:hypothetical protein [Candidatus Chloroploca sp. Khr17]|uniref:hypothetical protein n=1 Tax=Candidatus Chloroploca sp. Khr17 TaxID=2496869 RepID=UPI00101DE9CF|nr:hypothetical protein [Candidatus Chloroploca sp. Khr17]
MSNATGRVDKVNRVSADYADVKYPQITQIFADYDLNRNLRTVQQMRNIGPTNAKEHDDGV